jgi:hypothetical protein
MRLQLAVTTTWAIKTLKDLGRSTTPVGRAFARTSQAGKRQGKQVGRDARVR